MPGMCEPPRGVEARFVQPQGKEKARYTVPHVDNHLNIPVLER